ncbi:MAG: hypothetical protein RL702_683 [Pseudomonadota bacterium]|jgi:Cu-Zn family superoxide dismutase|nr:superoxide dismutase family protein [Novosphingobium sp.]HOA47866.1 superoxide dismutase family protein [Novosphingobium sp.]HPZ45593.1 superoxide dismutase family protein [Novosphingobium sp.]HQE00852.1 superoxide dismutase family protein [Novosphingobium sp.]
MKLAIVLAAGTLALAGCAAPATTSKTTLATATLRNASGAEIGTAVLAERAGALTLRITALGQPAGVHGIHLHAVGKCDAPDFTSAGPHLNPHGKQHGRENPAGTHLGDLPNIVIDSSGRGELSIELPGSRAENESTLFDTDGSAIVLHAKPDDNLTDPSGNSGARIACGVLTRT